MGKTFYIIDGHSQIFRAYYAPFRALTSPAGEPTRATYVFTTMLLNLVRDHKPDYLAMAMDCGVKDLARTQLFADYKGTRSAAPEDLAPQECRIEQIITAMHIPIWCGHGFEADDYLASAAAKFAGPGVRIVLVSRDKDLEQLLSDKVVMFDPMKGETIDPQWLIANKGYAPQQAVEVQTLIGDDSDNVPGVKGIGPKTAAKLIAQYGSAAEVVAHADELSPKLREGVAAFARQIDLTRQLVTLSCDAPLPTDMESCRWRGVDAKALLPIFRELDFKRLIEQMEHMAKDQPDFSGGGPAAVLPEAEVGARPEERLSPQAKEVVAAREAVVAAVRQTTAADFDYRLVDTVEQLESLVRDMAGIERLSVDTETTGKNAVRAELVGISLAWCAGCAAYIPVRGPMARR